MSMPQVHLVAYCGDLGYGPARGAQMLSLMLACGIVSRLTFGVICDRIGGLRTLLIGSALQGLSLFLFLPFDGLVSLFLISALFGLFQGGIVPSYAIIIREFFPPREAGARVGVGDHRHAVRHGARRLDVRRDLRRDGVVQGRVRQRYPVEPGQRVDRAVAPAPLDRCGRRSHNQRNAEETDAVIAQAHREEARDRRRIRRILGVARQVRAWSDSVLGIAGAAADVVDRRGQGDPASSPSSARRSRRRARVLRGMREAAGLSDQGSGRRDQPQRPHAPRPGRERQGRAAVRDHPAPRVRARAQRSHLVRHALHALVQPGSVEDARGPGDRPLRRSGGARARVRQHLPRERRRAAHVATRSSPRCSRSPGPRSISR